MRREEYSGIDCDGHWQTYLVAAESAEAASSLLPTEGWCMPNEVGEFMPPDLKRIRKARIVV